jgi:hypothetical protein
MFYRDENGYVWQKILVSKRREDQDDALDIYIHYGFEYKLSRNGRFCDKIDNIVKFEAFKHNMLCLDTDGKLHLLGAMVELLSNVKDFYVHESLILVIHKDCTSCIYEIIDIDVIKKNNNFVIPEGEILSFAINDEVAIATKKFEQQIRLFVYSNRWFEAHIENGELFINGEKYTCDSPAHYIRKLFNGVLVFCEDRSLYFASYDCSAAHGKYGEIHNGINKISNGPCFPVDYIPSTIKSARTISESYTHS